MFKVGVIYDLSLQALGGHGTHLAFRGLPVEIVALVDGQAEGVRERAERVGAKRVYRDFRAMLDTEHPDLVVLGSRDPVAHLEPLLEAVKRGMHVLCEKPLCTTLAEADTIIALARRTGSKVAVAHLARHSIIFRTLKSMLAAGAIGTPLSVYGRGKEDDRGGGEDLVVLGTHILDIMCYLFGPPRSLFAEVTKDGQPIAATDRALTREPLGPVAGDNIFVHINFPNQVRGLFESRKGIYQSGGQVRMGVTVAGTKGALSMRYTSAPRGEGDERKLRLTHSPYPVEDAADYQEVPLVEERVIPGAEALIMDYIPYFAINNRFAAWDLLQAIEENREPLAGAREAAAVLELIQGIYASQLSGRRIDFPLQERKHPLEAATAGGNAV
ncbi:MAG: Gfo/Idh/MocA family oxidoreductase [Lentisphaerae bacterium]|nr:Gfo/Idh/MocA family oxidoreductase [Lentisphaerota bacterium]